MATTIHRRTIAAIIAALFLCMVMTLPVSAGPATVGLTAGQCTGPGHTTLLAGGGAYSYSLRLDGCASETYLTSTHAYSGGSYNYTYGWYTGEQNFTTPVGNGITAAASTHNLRFIFDTNGYVNTNTW